MLIECQEKNIKKLCPTGAYSLFQKYMPKMTKAVLNDHCAYYTENDKCHVFINQTNVFELYDQSTNIFIRQTHLKINSAIMLNPKKEFCWFLIFNVLMLFCF